MHEYEIEALLGKTIISVTSSNDEIVFVTNDGTYKMFHYQDCCESVVIEDINGDLQGLVGHVVRLAEETTSDSHDYGDEDTRSWPGESETWTFYNISAGDEDVSIRWYGESNGYYSESVDVIRVSSVDIPNDDH
jgi:hypothetical protein